MSPNLLTTLYLMLIA